MIRPPETVTLHSDPATFAIGICMFTATDPAGIATTACDSGLARPESSQKGEAVIKFNVSSRALQLWDGVTDMLVRGL